MSLKDQKQKSSSLKDKNSTVCGRLKNIFKRLLLAPRIKFFINNIGLRGEGELSKSSVIYRSSPILLFLRMLHEMSCLGLNLTM